MAIPKKKLEFDGSQLTIGQSLLIFTATKDEARIRRTELIKSILVDSFDCDDEAANAYLLDEASQKITLIAWIEANKESDPDEHMMGESLIAILTGLFNWTEEDIAGITLSDLDEVQEMVRVAVEESRDKAVPPTSGPDSESGPAE